MAHYDMSGLCISLLFYFLNDHGGFLLGQSFTQILLKGQWYSGLDLGSVWNRNRAGLRSRHPFRVLRTDFAAVTDMAIIGVCSRASACFRMSVDIF